jgi:hypothetical protein
MAAHPQRWIKVNAPVDEGVSEIVEILNSVEGLETLQSCQGHPAELDGYVYFCFGNWTVLCKFIFQKIGPILKQRVDEDVRLIVEATDADAPMAKLSFKAEAASMVASALKEGLGYERP